MRVREEELKNSRADKESIRKKILTFAHILWCELDSEFPTMSLYIIFVEKFNVLYFAN